MALRLTSTDEYVWGAVQAAIHRTYVLVGKVGR